MVSRWAPSGTEKLWYEFIKEVKPELSLEVCKVVCNAMKVMEFSSVRMFQALTPVQLRDSRESWVGVTDDVWDVICFLKVASVPAPKPVFVKKSSQGVHVGLDNSPAVQVVGLSKTSV